MKRSRFAVLAASAMAVLAIGPAVADELSLPAPLTDHGFRPFDERQAELGRLLYYDRILSGNRNISCGTCHNHDLATTDRLALGVGEGGEGLGEKRTTGRGADAIIKRVPRNAPALFNLGHQDITKLFHDGRLSDTDVYGNGINSPAEEWLPGGLDDVVAAQSIFPLTSATEMAGQPRENEISGAANDRLDKVWSIVADRVRAIPEYGDLFTAAFDDIGGLGDISIVHIANALGAFINSEFRALDTPFDRWLAGEDTLTPQQERGVRIFYGKGNCAACHAGPLFSDQDFHALALPPFGPGRVRPFDPQPRDVGRMGETDRIEDAYRFRTPMLRNVAATAPYGHNGAYPTLEGIIRHHLDPQAAFDAWTTSLVSLPFSERLSPVDFAVRDDVREMARVRAKVDIEPVSLSNGEIADLVAFLDALTDEASLKGRLGKPDRVPSGLPID